MGTENSKFPGTTTGQPAVESPKRVLDRQMGQPSFLLGGRYLKTGDYVNSAYKLALIGTVRPAAKPVPQRSGP